ncbi:uncharacterized protein OCT59_013684 [Rhizophagus irregularis]|uniref:Uncharacterized protein n=1 Tax=Rhizophagus irregularis (strain DAOM 181602 / DAOM 197198 / MUCL 43194) TaxID=747089 RepID=U9UTQ9_RHIID|nr:hypothetical protein GLOIN_2v1543712 [Rhizophagus irregularis DAOM 181602=DAOM 197198]POG77783.1 hypothetical protein GLOIN_2v1543712 [Rhizophagus irregularis DAOM 181602=DAOM 197198]UZO21287.1 hypothetical protein OCT59_013684 [Rhizophagus irregularis]GBC45821.2 hypothetical protein GLOIN_2v1543712 [Rhizophagus irregularis DAOM 181602=DAOM 197198]|eukprot:XP_025184649.1 hypothetical protein GLOIN_2v1543712 [Rhizophagus irregularis DAOM 181602=DAOM 197198]
MKYFSSSIFQGIIIGWVTSVLIFILLVFVGMWGKITGLDVMWDLRVGLFLTAVTVTTKVISFIACFMMPAILTGMLVLNKIPTLNGSGAMISQLIEASITLSPLCTLKACFNSGKTRKLAIVIASVLVWQYTVSLADLYLHITAVGRSQQLPGLMIPSARSLDIAKNCSFSYITTCFRNKRGLSNPGKALKIYRNTSDTFQIWNNDDGVYLLQAPPLNTSYAYSGSGILLKPFCEPVSTLCNLKARYGAMTNYSCPESLWYASGNTQTVLSDVNVTSDVFEPIDNLYIALNPIHAIVTIRYNTERIEYDSEFVGEVHGGHSILLHCQILTSITENVVTLGSLKSLPLGNLTTSQQFALGVASSEGELLRRTVDDVEDVAHSTGNSTLFANAFAQQWAQATIAGFSSGAVQANGEGDGEGDGEGYGYVLEVIKEQTFAPLSAVLIYAIVITFPLFIFSCVCVFSLQNDTIWILVEFICTPQRLLYQALFKEHHMDDACSKSLSDQAMRIKEVECDVKLEEGHLKLTTKIQ